MNNHGIKINKPDSIADLHTLKGTAIWKKFY